MLPTEIIKKKRNKLELSTEEIEFFILEYTQNKIPDYQMSALLMAIFLNGMSNAETVALTKIMLHSGVTVDTSSIDGFKVDKHSTGGVGDKTSLILGPIVAAAGVFVPMISGRGLGHTGGTLDKLESIPGFNTQQSLEKFIELTRSVGTCFIGQTTDICPADKKIYALRDVTSTVESLPLICASIMSKKLAEGIDGLVLDVKFGSGAFMKDSEKGRELALALMNIAKSYNKKIVSLLTNMDQPLGRFAGNSLEVFECLEIMKNKKFIGSNGQDLYADTRELSLQLSAHMIYMSGKTTSLNAAYQLATELLESGAAFSKFEEMCLKQNGQILELPNPKHSMSLKCKDFINESSTTLYVSGFNVELIGLAGILLKAGRKITTDIINPTAGIEFHFKIGDSIKASDTLFTIHGDQPELFNEAAELLKKSVTFSNEKMTPPQLIKEVIF